MLIGWRVRVGVGVTVGVRLGSGAAVIVVTVLAGGVNPAATRLVAVPLAGEIFPSPERTARSPRPAGEQAAAKARIDRKSSRPGGETRRYRNSGACKAKSTKI
jgi:hypothetical protein